MPDWLVIASVMAVCVVFLSIVGFILHSIDK